MTRVALSAYDSTGAPLAGLVAAGYGTLTVYKRASTTLDVSPVPAPSDMGDGTYEYEIEEGCVGIVDFGPTAHTDWRYQAVTQDGTTTVFAVYDSSRVPLAGASPAFLSSVLRVVGSTDTYPAPAITAVGGGLFKLTLETTTRLIGKIDCGASASPRYLTFDNGPEGTVTTSPVATTTTATTTTSAWTTSATASGATICDLKLTADLDIAIEDGDLVLIYDADVVVQMLRIALLRVAGEWYLDIDSGVDYLGDVFPKGSGRETAIRDAILANEYVTGLSRFAAAYEPATRKLAIEFTAETDFGTITSRVEML